MTTYGVRTPELKAAHERQAKAQNLVDWIQRERADERNQAMMLKILGTDDLVFSYYQNRFNEANDELNLAKIEVARWETS